MKEADAGRGEDWGRLYVTRQCCGAATCRNLAPELLAEVPLEGVGPGGMPPVLPGTYDAGAFTGVIRQPANQTDFNAARAAAAACPFGAIRFERRNAGVKLPTLWEDYPRQIEDEVWVLGSPSQKDFGAMSYFIERPGGGVLVDLPKPSESLFRWLAEHGGVRFIFLTHKDHVAHHREFAARYPGATRILGRDDVNRRESKYAESTEDVEIKTSGEEPLRLDGTTLSLPALSEAELAILPQPGHTPGSQCLLYRHRFLFTGDHLAYSRRLEHIVGHRLQCWEDWERQVASVHRLARWVAAGHVSFEWILPGHGEWRKLDAAADVELGRALSWMEEQPPGHVPRARWIPFAISRSKPNSFLGRTVRFIGGEGPARDAWILPPSVRPLLPAYRRELVERTAAKLRRISAAVTSRISSAWH